jgi:hypothetical protein
MAFVQGDLYLYLKRGHRPINYNQNIQNEIYSSLNDAHFYALISTCKFMRPWS